MNDIQTAKFLGYLSIGLGLVELVAARRLTAILGLPIPAAVIRGFGARELAAGLGLVGRLLLGDELGELPDGEQGEPHRDHPQEDLSRRLRGECRQCP